MLGKIFVNTLIIHQWKKRLTPYEICIISQHKHEHELESRPLEWRLACTGLCSCRVRGVDGSCTKHLTVKSYMVIYASNSYTYYY